MDKENKFCYNNAILNFNKALKIPEIVYRTPDRLIFKCGKQIFWYLGYNEIPVEEVNEICNLYGNYNLEFIRMNANTKYYFKVQRRVSNKLFGLEKKESKTFKFYGTNIVPNSSISNGFTLLVDIWEVFNDTIRPIQDERLDPIRDYISILGNAVAKRITHAVYMQDLDAQSQNKYPYLIKEEVKKEEPSIFTKIGRTLGFCKEKEEEYVEPEDLDHYFLSKVFISTLIMDEFMEHVYSQIETEPERQRLFDKLFCVFHIA